MKNLYSGQAALSKLRLEGAPERLLIHLQGEMAKGATLKFEIFEGHPPSEFLDLPGTFGVAGERVEETNRD